MNARNGIRIGAVTVVAMMLAAALSAVGASAVLGGPGGWSPVDPGNPETGMGSGIEGRYGDDYGGLVLRERNTIENRYAWMRMSDDNTTMHVYRIQHANRYTRVFHFGLHANDTLVLTLDHGVGTYGQRHMLRMRLVLSSLIEYEDVNGDGAYQPGTDRAVSSLTLSKFDGIQRYGGIDVVNFTTPYGQTVRACEVETLDGHFMLRVYATNTNVSLGPNALTPKKLKFDFEIRDYPFAEDGTKVALVGGLVRYNERNRFTFRNQWDQPGAPSSGMDLNDENGRRRAYFSWMNEAMVDGANCSVNASVIKNDLGYVTGFAFSYDRGELIVHDPDIGIFTYDDDFAIDASKILTASLLVFGVTMIVAVVALVVLKAGSKRGM